MNFINVVQTGNSKTDTELVNKLEKNQWAVQHGCRDWADYVDRFLKRHVHISMFNK